MKRKTLISLATGAAIAALWPTAARAERDLSLLMNMDHHLVRADFIAVVQIDAQALFTDASGVPLQSVVLDASNVLASRWPDTNFEVITSAGFDHFEMGAEYLVLMSGGPWAESPFTHRVNSVFRVEPDGTLSCSGGDRLYGVFGDGFYCAPEGSVAGTVMTLDEASDALLCARERSMMRLPTLTAQLDELARPLELEPSPIEALEVRR